MEPTTTGAAPAPAPEPAATPEPAAPAAEPASTPNPTADGTQPNPAEGTGQPAATQLRNEPTAGAPEGYVTSDKFTASQQEAIRLNDLVKSLGYDPKTGQPVAQPAEPSTPTPAPTQPISVEQAAAQIPGFSSLNPQEQALVLNPRQAYKDISDMQRMVATMYDQQETTRQINDLVKGEDYKDLDKDAFRDFIYKEENLGVKNLETLAKMFKLEAAPAPAAPVPEGPEPTTAGAKEIATTAGVTEVSGADAAKMRTEDPKQYAKLLQSGKLRIVKD